MLRYREHDISYQKQETGQSHNFVVLKNKQNKKKQWQVIHLKMENYNNE